VDTLRDVIAEVLRIDVSKITPDLSIHQTATWNSLTHIELVVAIEDRFRIQLTEDEIVALTTVDKIEKTLAARGAIAKS
jgi:acyl carrier protein